MRILAKIYNAIKNALTETQLVSHIDLWNHNVEFIEMETAWERPAVFVEIRPIRWEPIKCRVYRARVEIALHIVTDWNGSASSETEMWRLPDLIAEAIDRLRDNDIRDLKLEETNVDHNHEELIETIEIYSCRVTRRV